MTLEQLRSWMDAYITSLNDTDKDEWWCTDKVGYSVGINGFFDWYSEQIKKEERHKQYLILKEEFEGKQNG